MRPLAVAIRRHKQNIIRPKLRGAIYGATCTTYLKVKLHSGILNWSQELRIAFGFKVNGSAVMQGVDYELVLGGKPYSLNIDMIAASGAGYPTGALLKKIFALREETAA